MGQYLKGILLQLEDNKAEVLLFDLSKVVWN
jgi:hypothetical protein